MLSNSNRPELQSGSEKPIVIGAKIDFYRLHEHCRAALVVRQDRVEADVYSRAQNWQGSTLGDPRDRVVIPDIGNIGPLAHFYRYTPHWQTAWAGL